MSAEEAIAKIQDSLSVAVKYINCKDKVLRNLSMNSFLCIMRPILNVHSTNGASTSSEEMLDTSSLKTIATSHCHDLIHEYFFRKNSFVSVVFLETLYQKFPNVFVESSLDTLIKVYSSAPSTATDDTKNMVVTVSNGINVFLKMEVIKYLQNIFKQYKLFQPVIQQTVLSKFEMYIQIFSVVASSILSDGNSVSNSSNGVEKSFNFKSKHVKSIFGAVTQFIVFWNHVLTASTSNHANVPKACHSRAKALKFQSIFSAPTTSAVTVTGNSHKVFQNICDSIGSQILPHTREENDVEKTVENLKELDGKKSEKQKRKKGEKSSEIKPVVSTSVSTPVVNDAPTSKKAKKVKGQLVDMLDDVEQKYIQSQLQEKAEKVKSIQQNEVEIEETKVVVSKEAVEDTKQVKKVKKSKK